MSETWKKGTVDDRWELAKKKSMLLVPETKSPNMMLYVKGKPVQWKGVVEHHPHLYKTDMLRLNHIPSMQTDASNAQ